MEKMSKKQREEHRRAEQAKKEASWPSAIEAGEYSLGVTEDKDEGEQEEAVHDYAKR
jgi:hypothetical protein